MIEIGSRARASHRRQTSCSRRSYSRTALQLGSGSRVLDDEQLPTIGRTEEFTLVTWSSLWIKRADAVIRFDLDTASGGTNLSWTVFVDDPPPDDALIGHVRKRMNQLINANLRFSFGQ